MVECDNEEWEEGTWFHLECVGLEEDNIPDEWFCYDKCRKVKNKDYEHILLKNSYFKNLTRHNIILVKSKSSCRRLFSLNTLQILSLMSMVPSLQKLTHVYMDTITVIAECRNRKHKLINHVRPLMHIYFRQQRNTASVKRIWRRQWSSVATRNAEMAPGFTQYV